MGKRTRSQRKGSSPKNKVSSHRFPAANKLPRVSGKIAEVVDLIHSPVHTTPLAKIKFEDGHFQSYMSSIRSRPCCILASIAVKGEGG
jgi:ribosomal protein L2